MQYRTADSCWSQQEKHLYHTADNCPHSEAFSTAVGAFERMQERVRAAGRPKAMGVGRRQIQVEQAATSPWARQGALPLHCGGRHEERSWQQDNGICGVLRARPSHQPGHYCAAPCLPHSPPLQPFAHSNTSWTVGPPTYDLILGSVFQRPRLLLTSMAEQLRATQGAARTDLPWQVINKGAVWMDLYRRSWSKFCDDLWSTADAAPFWLASIDAYIVPSLHYIPHFADRLKELFPEGTRFLIHPDNELWAQITTTFHANLAHFSHRLGLQIRSPDGIQLPLSGRILQCGAAIAHYLPYTRPYTQALLKPGGGTFPHASHAPHRTMGVFVSSLSMKHTLELQAQYSQNMPVGNTLVGFWSLTSEEIENRKEQHLVATVIDIWLLSFCDRLLITHLSSFGRVAAGLGGIDAYSMAITVVKMRGIDWREMGGPVCERVPCEPCDSVGGNVQWSGCSWDFNRSRLAHGSDRPPGFGFCAGFQFGLQDRNPLTSHSP
ncbi:hypothetical protein CLOP_g10036 [Closterium sp. NIES-67]|nr:hypothetical protein CLOP_g10036 [Closterium sp. NIES-67]